jgi:hypothetical protein
MKQEKDDLREGKWGGSLSVCLLFLFLSLSFFFYSFIHPDTHKHSRYPRKRQRETERELTYSKGEDPSITELPEHPEEKKTRVFFFSFELLNEQSRGRESLLQIMRIEKKNAESFLQETNQKEDEGERGLSVKNEEGLYLYLFTNQ